MKALLALLALTAAAAACPLCSLLPARAPAGYAARPGAETTHTVTLDAAATDALLAALGESFIRLARIANAVAEPVKARERAELEKQIADAEASKADAQTKLAAI